MDMDNNFDTTTRGRCRVCLKKDVDVLALSLTVCVFAEEVTLSQMLNTCCAVEISANDLKPQNVCNNCAKTAEKLFIFRRTCQNAELILQEELDGVNIKLEPYDLIIKEEHEEDDHKEEIMAAVKNEFRDHVLISNTENQTPKQNTSSTERNVCKLCQTYFTDWISLEHHLENCYRPVCGNSEEIFADADALYEHTQTHEILSTDKTVVLNREKSKRHKCEFCKMSYKFPVELRNHLMSHTTVKHNVCIYCGNKFSLSHRSICKRTQTQHSRKHIYAKAYNRASDSLNTPPRFGCSIRKKLYCRQQLLMNHKCINTNNKPHKLLNSSDSKLTEYVGIHSGEKPYACTHCSKRFIKRGKLTEHIRTHTGERPYECSHCSKRFTTQGNLTVHKRNHTGEKPYECSHCSKRFTTQRELTVHVRIHTGEKPYECSHCSKRFTVKPSLTVHERIHTGEKPYECLHCSMRFTNRSHRNVHIRIHTGEKPYECSHCSKRFTRLSSLTLHKRIHTGEMPYECSHCSKRFTTKRSLTGHERIHTGEKPYECSHCSKRFPIKRSLTAHERAHTGEKPYECSHCSKRFINQSHLKVHIRSHTGEKPYGCSYCSARFADKSNKTRHECTHTGKNLTSVHTAVNASPI